MLEQKQGICIKFRTKLWSQIFNFRLIILMIEDLPTEIYFFQKYWFFWLWPAIKKNFALKNWKSSFITLCGIHANSKTVLVFILALIVFDFYSFEGSKNTLYRRAKYNIYKCIYWVLLLCLEAINTSYQGTICSCMIFQPSCFILYFIFPMNLVVFYSLFYNDVTTLLWRHSFLTDLNENCTAYVKLKTKDILFVIFFFWFSEYLLRKLRLITKITSIVQLPYTPIPFGPPIRVGFVRDTSLTYLRILFNTKNKKMIIVFT